MGCGAPAQPTQSGQTAQPGQTATLPAGVNADVETVITGVVTGGGGPVAGAYVRLLDSDGEFTAEVVTSETGNFRFFAAPGSWTLSVLHRDGAARASVETAGPGTVEAELALA